MKYLFLILLLISPLAQASEIQNYYLDAKIPEESTKVIERVVAKDSHRDACLVMDMAQLKKIMQRTYLSCPQDNNPCTINMWDGYQCSIVYDDKCN